MKIPTPLLPTGAAPASPNRPARSPRAWTAACAALLLSTPAGLLATDYYVAPPPTGSDTSGNGSQTAPYQTIAKALSRPVPSGSTNTIYLQRGGTWREDAATGLSNRILAAYGNTALPAPVWSGSEVVTNWAGVPGRTGVFSATFTGGTPTRVYVNGLPMTLARYPNTGWLFTDSYTGFNSIPDAALSSAGSNVLGNPRDAENYWVGAQARWRAWHWWYETRPITAYSASTDTLTLSGSTSDPGVVNRVAGTGYFIQNKFEELDAPGEWYWDAPNQRLYLYPPAGVNLSTALVEAAVRTTGPTLNSGAGLNGITFRHFSFRAVVVQRPVTIENCTFEKVGGSANNEAAVFLSWDSSPSTVRNCSFRDVHGTAIRINQNPGGASGTLVERNRFERIGMDPALSSSETFEGCGINATNFNAPTIQLNSFIDIGADGVNIEAVSYNYGSTPQPTGTGAVVKRNLFLRNMAVVNDGGAIRFVGDFNLAEENIILDTIGDMVSSEPFTPLGHGIWFEFIGRTPPGSTPIPFTGNRAYWNTVYGSNGHGIFNTANRNSVILNNTLVSNRLSGLHLTIRSTFSLAAGHYVASNILANGAAPWQAQPGETPQRIANWVTLYEQPLSYVVPKVNGVVADVDYASNFTGTTFVNRAGDLFVRKIIQNGPSANLTIPQWQTEEPDWADPAPLAVSGATYLFINNSETSGGIPLPAGVTWQRLDGTPVTGIWLNPYRSTLLVAAAGNVSGLQPYYLRVQP